MARNPIWHRVTTASNVAQRFAIKWVTLLVWAWVCSLRASDSPWKLARACYDLAEYAANDDQRARIAQQGITTCRDALTLDPANAKILYYLAMNLGQLARTKSLGALRIVKEMEELFEKARVLDESLDHAGPDRCLGLLYQEAPGWPTSIGNRKKAVVHFRRAAQLAPGYPENRLLLIKSLILHRDMTGAGAEWATAQASWVQGQTNFTGVAWEPMLVEWEGLRQWIRRKLDLPTPSP